MDDNIANSYINKDYTEPSRRILHPGATLWCFSGNFDYQEMATTQKTIQKLIEQQQAILVGLSK